MDGDSIFGYQLQNRKRTHDQMERSSSIHSSRLSTPSLVVRDPSAGPSHSTTQNQTMPRGSISHLRLPPMRYVGDGLDFRRPMSSTPAQSEPQVIDLTSEDDTPQPSDVSRPLSPPGPQQRPASRAPRFGRDIIDLSSDPPSPPVRHAQPPPHNLSPEVEFVSSRPLQAPHHRLPDPQRPIDLDLIDNDFEIISERPLTPSANLNGINAPPPADGGFPLRATGLGALAEYRDLQRQAAGRRYHVLNREVRRAMEELENQRGEVVHLQNQLRRLGGGQFVAPQLDFMNVGFDMGLRRDRSASPAVVVPPPPPPEGFTRSPQEGDVLVCPNCGDELGVGRSPVKRQVWVVKACGHVYCGECTAARSKSKRKGKEPAKGMPTPFKACVVEGCGKKCSSKSHMLQLFL